MESPSIFIWPKRFDLGKFIFDVDLNFDCGCPLCIILISNWEGSCKMGQNQNDHLDIVLQTMQNDFGV